MLGLFVVDCTTGRRTMVGGVVGTDAVAADGAAAGAVVVEVVMAAVNRWGALFSMPFEC